MPESRPVPYVPSVKGPTTALKARLEVLEAKSAKVEALAAGHRADFERERERFDGLMEELSVHHGCTVEGERSHVSETNLSSSLADRFHCRC